MAAKLHGMTRMMRSIQSQKANLLFFNGDMIMGYGKAGVPVGRTSNGVGEGAIASPVVSDIVTSDLMQFYQQYAFWRGTVANIMETGTYVVPVPGNHEVQCKRCGKTAQIENETAWRDNMGDLILDQTRLNNLLSAIALSATNVNVTLPPAINSDPTLGDLINTDQKQLSYSFEVGTAHFAVINTDPVGHDSTAPTKWLDADLTAAVGKGAKQLFVFGHKPAFFYKFTGSKTPDGTSSLYDKDPVAGNAFWNVINSHNATYFAGHEHIYHVTQPDGANTAYQVIVGAGGSPFEDANKTGMATTDRLYSWATVSIYKSGKVVLNTYGFDDTLINPIVKLETFTLPAAQ